MNLDDLIPAPDSKKIASVSQKVFGRSIKVESLTQEKAQSLRETFAARLNSLETKLGANVANNPAYLENKLFLETIDTYLGEGDGIYHDCATKFTHETYGECTVIPGEHTLLEDGTVTHYDATFVGEDGDQYIVRNVAVENMSNVISEGHKHKMEEDNDEMSDAARELELYAENDGQLYQQSGVPIMKNLSRKFKKGTYDSALAAKLWKYHADRAAKGYSQEYSSGDDWKTMFTPAVRMEVAKSMEASWRAEMEAGNFMESAQATESVIVEGMAEVSEVVLASKNMVDKMQAMVEDLGEMVNEDLPALTDSIRNDIDSATADQFSAAMSEVVSNALEVMRMSREGADAASRILTGEQIAEPESIGAPIDGEMDMEPTTDMDMDGDIADEEDFASADAAQDGEEELGRERRA